MNKIDRREFIRIAGASAAALGAAACTPKAVKAQQDEESAAPQIDENAKMEMRVNQNSGDSVSLLGYGCLRWQMKKDENGKDIIDQDSVNELVDYALAHGVNYFDSSPVYIQGLSERATAIALLRHPRESYMIATKLSNFSNSSRENSMLMYRKSFEYYETDYIDYYLAHSIKDYADFKRRYEDNGMMEFLLEERKAGRIRNLGFSFHGHKEGFDQMMELHDKYHWDFVQIQMNYVDWELAGGLNTRADYLYAELDKREIPIVIMEPLLGGRLSSVPKAIATEFKRREPAKSTASWAFRFVGTYPRVLTVLSGMTYMEHLQDNLSSYCGFQPLDQDELTFLKDIAVSLNNYPLVKCTACQYCMPCPYGIDIPGIFKFYNDTVNEGTFVSSKEQAGYSKLRKAHLTQYNTAIPTVRQADHCISCAQCVSHCPQHIKIPGELRRIDKYIESLKRETL